MGNFKEDIVKTEAFVFDVDGVFTDGGITPFGDDFIRRYYAKDGYAVSYASKLGYKICIITGGRGKWLQERFERLRVTKIYADCADKIAALREFLDEYGLDARNVVFMGDDIPDLECMRAVGIPVAPADAASEILEAARYVSSIRAVGAVCATSSSRCCARAASGRSTARASTARRRPNRSDRRPVRRKSVIRVRQTVIRLPVRPCGTRIFASEEIPFGLYGFGVRAAGGNPLHERTNDAMRRFMCFTLLAGAMLSGSCDGRCGRRSDAVDPIFNSDITMNEQLNLTSEWDKVFPRAARSTTAR